MTAPERIWALPDEQLVWTIPDVLDASVAGYAEYIRADIHAAALEREAALREALEEIDARGPDTDAMYSIAFELAGIARAALGAKP